MSISFLRNILFFFLQSEWDATFDTTGSQAFWTTSYTLHSPLFLTVTFPEQHSRAEGTAVHTWGDRVRDRGWGVRMCVCTHYLSNHGRSSPRQGCRNLIPTSPHSTTLIIVAVPVVSASTLRPTISYYLSQLPIAESPYYFILHSPCLRTALYLVAASRLDYCSTLHGAPLGNIQKILLVLSAATGILSEGL